MMREHDNSLYVPGNSASVEEQWEKRAAVLDAVAEDHFDALIVELFPFGRRKFRKEIFHLQDTLLRKNPGLLSLCSLRDIMIQSLSEPKRVEEILEFLRKRFHQVLVHSDPALLPLERTWPAAAEIQELLVYTGFVAEAPREAPAPHLTPRKEILVSAGGGNVGLDLYEAVAECAPDFPDHHFVFVVGPYMQKLGEGAFREKVSALPNAECVDFLSNFEQRLAQSKLSISLAGYNTTMNVLRSGTPALLYPYRANWEQEIRVQVLAERGCFLPLTKLARRELTESIKNALNFQPMTIAVDLEGSLRSREIVHSLLYEGENQ